jgi:hypothetical protein
MIYKCVQFGLTREEIGPRRRDSADIISCLLPNWMRFSGGSAIHTKAKDEYRLS